MFKPSFVYVLVLGCLAGHLAPASAYEVSFTDGRGELTPSQVRDFANEWAFVGSLPIVGPTDASQPWRPWFSVSENIRSVNPGRNAWIAHPHLAKDVNANVNIPFIHAGLGLPGGFQGGLLVGQSINANLRVAGAEVNYPFLLPSVKSPGLWARVAYAYPMGLHGMRMHLPSAGLYLTNEFLRVPMKSAPLRFRLHAGLQQTLVVSFPDGHEGNLTFPASTQFLIGLGYAWNDWAIHTDIGYGTGATTMDEARRSRAFWNQSYRLSYHFAAIP